MPTTRRTLDPVDVAGAQVSVTVEVTTADPVPLDLGHRDPVIGATVVAGDFALFAPGGRNAGARFVRTFSPPGAGIAAWGVDRRAVPAGVAEWHSFKDYGTDAEAVARVVDLLDHMPPALLDEPPLLPELDIYDPDGYAERMPQGDGLSFLLTYFHEGEKDFLQQGLTVREWRRRHRVIYKAVRQHRNGHRVGYVPIQTGTWTAATSTAGNPKGDYDVMAWWAGIGDYAGYDAYVPSIITKPAAPALYPTPADFFALPLQLAAGSGRRLLLAELGVIRQGTPAQVDSGAMRAVWMRAAATYLKAHNVAGVAWWDALGANQRDFRLTDPDSAAAWADVIAGRY